MAVTMQDLAQAAGVSRGTVDRVINHRGKVNPQVEQTILALAKQLGYEPKRGASPKARGKREVRIGCLLPSVDNRFFTKILNGFQKAERDYRDQGVRVLVEQVKGYDKQTHLAAIDQLVAQNVTGLCVITMDDPDINARLNQLICTGVPVITSNSDISNSNRLCYLGCNPVESGRAAAGLFRLLTNGHADVIVITGSVKMQGHNHRIQGFQQVITEDCLAIRIAAIEECSDDNAMAYRLTRAALEKHPEADGIYVVAAGTAGVCQAVVERGAAGRIKIVCHDDPPATRALIEGGVIQATICQHTYLQGYRPVKMLIQYLMEGIVPEKDKFFTHSVIKIKENL